MRALKVLGILVAVVGLLVVAAMLLVQSGWGERRLEAFAAERIGREVELEGLRLRAAWPLQVELATLRIANPAWARERYLLDARGMRASVAPGPLLRGRIVATAAVDEAAIGLQRDGQRNTWELDIPESQSGEAARVELRSASIGELRASYLDERDRTDVTVRAGGDIGREGRPFQARAEGRLRGEPLEASAEAPAVPLGGEQAVEVSLQAKLGESNAAGTLALRAANGALQSIEGRLEASGPSFAALSRIARAELPKSRPWRVTAQVRHETGRWQLDDIRATLGKSDLQGSATLEMRKERPFLRAKLESNLFDFEETGIKRRVKEEVKEKDARQEFLVPRDPWPTDGWDLLDADIELHMKKLRNIHPVPLDSLRLHAIMENRALRIDPLELRLANGTVKGPVALNASESPAEANMQMDIRGLQLARLVPNVEQKKAALGRLNGHIELTGRGDSPGEWLGSANGRILFAAERGQASALLVEVLGLDAAESVMLIGKKRDQPLRCAVMNLAVKDGRATASPFVIDVTDSVLSVEGSVNLGKEALDMKARAEPRDTSPFTLRTPVNITGTFLDPKVRPQAGPLAGRGAAAVALAAVNPLLALIPFVDPGGDPEPGCQPQKR